MLISWETLSLLANEGDEEAGNLIWVVWGNECADSRVGAPRGDFLIVSKQGALILEYL